MTIEVGTLEFFKLDSVDKKVLFWLMDNKPEEIQSWVAHICNDYKSFQRLTIDETKLLTEIFRELEK